MPRISRKAEGFTESVIREMTRIANQHEAINLAQGFPDFPMPEPMKEAACAAINGDINQYAVTWGSAALRIAIASKYRKWYNMEVDPDREVTVTCGATEAMASVFMALIDPGDEVIVMEPFYDRKTADLVARQTNAKVLVLPPSVGGVPGVTDYVQLMKYDMDQLAATLRTAGE